MPGYDHKGLADTFLPTVDLTGKVGYAVMYDSAVDAPPKGVTLCDDANAFIGIVLYEGMVYDEQDIPPALFSGQRACTVISIGRAKCISSAAIGNGVPVTVEVADGRIRAAVATETAIGWAENAVGAADQIVTVNLHGSKWTV